MGNDQLSCSYGLDDGIVAYDEPFDDELFRVIDYNNLQLFASLAPTLDGIHNVNVLNIDQDWVQYGISVTIEYILCTHILEEFFDSDLNFMYGFACHILFSNATERCKVSSKMYMRLFIACNWLNHPRSDWQANQVWATVIERVLLMRIASYVICNLCIKTHKKLYSICDVDFQSFEYIVQGKYVKFTERESTNIRFICCIVS